MALCRHTKDTHWDCCSLYIPVGMPIEVFLHQNHLLDHTVFVRGLTIKPQTLNFFQLSESIYTVPVGCIVIMEDSVLPNNTDYLVI